MNPFASLPGLLEIVRDPIGVPVAFMIVVVLAWTVVAAIGTTAPQGELVTDDRRPGWW